MITPNIAPRKITGSAAAGLFSAAKSSVRTMERTTNTLVKSPDITKEQKFGINYVQFFGSKKNAKILKKSLKSIRDSLVATFAIAKMLRSEVSKNVKLIGEKTKGKKGLFGLGFGGILGIINLLTNPIVLTVLGGLAGAAGVGFLTRFLIDNRSQIAEFIMDKSKGLYNTLQGLVTEVLRDFLGDRFKDPTTRNIEVESENEIEETMGELLGKDKETGKLRNPSMTRGQARIEAIKIELERLTAEQDELETLGSGRSLKQDKEFEAIKKRIEQLKTGKSKFDRTDTPLPLSLFQTSLQNEFQRKPAFETDEDYRSLSNEEKLKKIKGLIGNFRSKGNSMDQILEIYGRSLQPGGEAFDDPDKARQAMDIIEYARRDDKRTRGKEGGITSDNFNFDSQPDISGVNNISGVDASSLEGVDASAFSPVTKEDLIGKGLMRDQSGGGQEIALGDNLDLPAANNIVSAKPDLSQVPVEAKSSPTMRFYSNFDPDNMYPGLNGSLLNITP
tara:strand:- start:2152 stop:3663 length:1512 start_codon:yes stop_codon:yes gene_type:complete